MNRRTFLNAITYIFNLLMHVLLLPVGMSIILVLIELRDVFNLPLLEMAIVQLALASYTSERTFTKEVNRILGGVSLCCMLIVAWVMLHYSDEKTYGAYLGVHTFTIWVALESIRVWKPTAEQSAATYGVFYQLLNAVRVVAELYWIVNEMAKLSLFIFVFGYGFLDFPLSISCLFVILQLLLLRFLSSNFYEPEQHKPALFEAWRVVTAVFTVYVATSNIEAMNIYQARALFYSIMIWQRFNN